jgi:ParB-like nuclease family protein
MLKHERFPIAKIYVPVKRRATLNLAVVNEIAESMLEVGQQAPILVRRDGDGFVLLEGLHRLEACKALGEETILGFLVPAQVEHQKALAPHEAEVEAIRRKTERLRQLRLAKEAAERSSAAFTAPTGKATETVIRERPSRSGCMTARSKPATLSEWLAGRERDGFRS